MIGLELRRIGDRVMTVVRVRVRVMVMVMVRVRTMPGDEDGLQRLVDEYGGPGALGQGYRYTHD